MLGRYPHRKDIAGPKRRIAAWGQNFEQLSKVLLQLPSRSLYYVIAECLAAVTVNSPSLHIRAVGTVKGFANYVHHATMSASVALKSPTVRLRQCVAQMPKQTVVHKRTKKPHVYSIQQWPCNAKTQILQKEMTMQRTGLQQITKFACTHCSVLHVKIGKPPRAAKLHMGVSINIFKPTEANCNKCNKKATLVTLSGNVTRAMVGKKIEVVSICSICGTFSNDLKVHGTLLCCSACAVERQQAYINAALQCPCNISNATPSQHIFIAKQNGKYVLVRACTRHAHLATTNTVAEVSAWATIFNATCSESF